MKFRDRDPDDILDAMLSEMRQSELGQEDVAQSACKVWDRLSDEDIQSFTSPVRTVERIRSCEDVQNLLPAFVQDKIENSTALLVSDHLRECVPCRRALREWRTGKDRYTVPVPANDRRGSAWRMFGWAAAAVVVLGLALTYAGFLDALLPAPAGPRGVVALIDGTVFRVSAEGNQVLRVGDEIAEGDEIRTAKKSTAVLTLRDGSLVELGERAQLALTENRGGKTIDLVRGRIIVEAAEQRRGYLRVAATNCLVSVKGTVFSVNSGTKGSRVAVIQGTVAVEMEGVAKLLTSGQQVSSGSLRSVPLEREIAWSRNSSDYLALLRELSALQKDIESSLVPVVHTSTALLDLAPADTMIYISIPNLTTSLEETLAVFERRLAESVVLQQWWAEKGSDLEPVIRETLNRLTNFGAFLNEEVVIGFQPDEKGEPSEPFAMALVSDEAGFRRLLDEEVARVNGEAGKTVLVVLDDPFAAASDEGFEGLFLFVREGLFLASPSLQRLRELSLSTSSGTHSFVGTPFYNRIAQAYEDGVGFLLAVDLQHLLAGQLTGEPDDELEALEAVGLLDAQHVVVERKPTGDHSETRAVVSFSDTRRGLASWLADPAPIGALEFVSADATVVAAFAVKDPVLMVDDLFDIVSRADPETLLELAAFEQEKGISIRQDIAVPLGGELVFALDGPVLPKPAWKLIVEVYDPVAFQKTLSWLVGQINLEAGTEGPQLELLTNQAEGKTYYSVVSARTDLAVHYIFVDGYMVAAPSKGLLVDTLQFRETGYTFPESERFSALLPEDGQANFSGFFYQDFATLLRTFSSQLPSSIGNISPEDLEDLRTLLAEAQPTLVYAYGEADQITLATTGDSLAPFGLGGAMGLASSVGVGRILEEIEKSGRDDPLVR